MKLNKIKLTENCVTCRHFRGFKRGCGIDQQVTNKITPNECSGQCAFYETTMNKEAKEKMIGATKK